jgi:hypothetical protein
MNIFLIGFSHPRGGGKIGTNFTYSFFKGGKMKELLIEKSRIRCEVCGKTIESQYIVFKEKKDIDWEKEYYCAMPYLCSKCLKGEIRKNTLYENPKFKEDNNAT